MRRSILFAVFSSLLYGGSGFLGSKPVLWDLTDPIETKIPVPPDCSSLSAPKVEVPIRLTQFMLNTSTPVMEGVILWSEEVSTSCTYYFFGSEGREILNRKILMPDDSLLQRLSGVTGVEGEIVDLTEEPLYICSWPKTTLSKSVRTYQKFSFAYPTLHGGFTIDGEEWIPIRDQELYRHEHRLFKVSKLHEKACPIIEIKSYSGSMHVVTGSQYRVTILSDELQFTLDMGHPLAICSLSQDALFYTDLGFIVSLNYSLIQRSSSVSLTELILERSHIEFDIRDAQLNYDLETLQETVNKNFMSVYMKLCMVRAQKWRQITKDRDEDGLAVYVTGDLFAEGSMEGNKFYTRVRVPIPDVTTTEHFTYRRGQHIRWFREGTWIDVESISGIVKPSKDPNLLIPPLVLLENGSYLNIETLAVRSVAAESSFIRLDLHELHRGMSQEDTYRHWDNIPLSHPSSASYRSVLNDAWDWVSSEYNYLKMLGWLLVGCLVTFTVIKLIFCVGSTFKLRRSPPTSPDRSHPQRLNLLIGRRTPSLY